jgi:hypothetical protein
MQVHGKVATMGLEGGCLASTIVTQESTTSLLREQLLWLLLVELLHLQVLKPYGYVGKMGPYVVTVSKRQGGSVLE